MKSPSLPCPNAPIAFDFREIALIAIVVFARPIVVPELFAIFNDVKSSGEHSGLKVLEFCFEAIPLWYSNDSSGSRVPAQMTSDSLRQKDRLL
jgi:hypothetical protein